MFVNAGANFVVPDFNNVIDTGGDLFVMADQVRRSVAWAYKNAASFGGDADRFYISGHSSGGHWVGVLLTTDWQKDFWPPTDLHQGGGRCQRHVRSQACAAFCTFVTDEMEEKLSAQRHLSKLVVPVHLVYGTLETPEFQRQSRDFNTALKAAGKSVAWKATTTSK